MKVAELIDRLRKLDPDRVVMCLKSHDLVKCIDEIELCAASVLDEDPVLYTDFSTDMRAHQAVFIS